MIAEHPLCRQRLDSAQNDASSCRQGAAQGSEGALASSGALNARAGAPRCDSRAARWATLDAASSAAAPQGLGHGQGPHGAEEVDADIVTETESEDEGGLGFNGLFAE